MTTDWSRLEAARSYAQRGWLVFPLHSIRDDGSCSCGRANAAENHAPGKHPRTKNGVLDASVDDDQITAWWTEHPDANVGIRTGIVSHLAVGDIDPRNGGFDNPDLLKLESNTLKVRTGGGGLHLYYHLDAPVRTHDLSAGIELKGEGGYVVAPPSNHTRGVYSWLDQSPIVDIPTWLMNGAAPAPGPTIVEPDQREWVARELTQICGQGKRHTTLIRLAGYFRNTETETVALAILTEWGVNYCEPSLSIAEVTATVRDVFSRYAGTHHGPTEIWTARSLLNANFPPLQWVVEGLLPEGLCFLAGRPKRGKSWLALQIAIDVISGRNSFGQTSPGRVIYFGLEDSPRRLQARLLAMQAIESDDLIFPDALGDIDNGGLVQLTDLIEEYEPRLVVIDTLARVMGRKRDQDSTNDMTNLLAPLQLLSSRAHCCILPIDHHRKPGAEMGDMIDDITGSTAKAAVADAILGLYRKSGENSAVLKVTGRDVEERDLSLVWNPLKFHWKLETEPGLNSLQKSIVAGLRILKEATATAIAQHLGLNVRTIQGSVQDLVTLRILDQETIQTEKRGRPSFLYRLAN